jgi:sec-independent protein translocase protein TatB
MFGVDTTEFLIVALAALIFIGPKELPGAMRTLGRWVGQARAHARHFTSGIENMMREVELEEMEKRWREENERIMREHPMSALPYVGASVSAADQRTNDSFGSSEIEAPAAERPSTAARADEGGNPDEPTLPLPEPDHHRRELP